MKLINSYKQNPNKKKDIKEKSYKLFFNFLHFKLKKKSRIKCVQLKEKIDLAKVDFKKIDMHTQKEEKIRLVVFTKARIYSLS